MTKIAAILRSRVVAQTALLFVLCALLSSCSWLRGEFAAANRLPASCKNPEGAQIAAGALSRP